MQFLTSENVPVLLQGPYSPNMSSCDFFLFARAEQVVKEKHFESIIDIPSSVMKVIQDLPVESFQKCYEN